MEEPISSAALNVDANMTKRNPWISTVVEDVMQIKTASLSEEEA